MKGDPYKKLIFFYFEDDEWAEGWYITNIEENLIEVEEVRKNGQEDEHIYVQLERAGNSWKPSIDEYTSKEVKKAGKIISNYINKHGLPN